MPFSFALEEIRTVKLAVQALSEKNFSHDALDTFDDVFAIESTQRKAV